MVAPPDARQPFTAERTSVNFLHALASEFQQGNGNGVSAVKPTDAWRGAQTAGKDLLRFGIAIFVAAGFSALQVFVIPRLLDVTTYGHYRLFLVYVSYLAIFHLGIADGAFLRWVGRPAGIIAREWPLVFRWLILTHGALLIVAGIVAGVASSHIVKVFALAFAVGALCINASLLSAYALQAAGDFSRAGRVAMMSNGVFVGLAVLTQTRTLEGTLALYVGAFALAAVYGAWGVRHLHGEVSADDNTDLPEPRKLIVRGAPVLGANLAAALAQSIDRVLVSVFAPITAFALYGFASTASVAAASATQALSRVALSHAARRSEEQRAAFLAGYYDVIAAGYGLALAALPLFDRLVRYGIPDYADALPIVRAITLGLPAWVGTHVVIVGTLQSYGLVRRQLAVELSGVALVAALCTASLISHQPLWFVAAAASVAAVVTLIIGAAFVFQSSAPTGMRATLTFTVVTLLQGAALMAAVYGSTDWRYQTLIYIGLGALPTLFAARRARSHGW
jgi:O-antigen/teichoic acid export membrane protein